MTKEYKCICGKVCYSPASFNGHKQGCKVHIVNKYGSLEAYYTIKNRNHTDGSIVRERAQRKKQADIEQWISEKHTCERCGVIMTQKWGVGRFCSHKCANTREQTDQTKEQIAKSVSKTNSSKGIKLKNEQQYNLNPNFCEVCNKPLPYNQRIRKTCSKECEIKWHSVFRNNYIMENGVTEFQKKGYKYGIYKDINCDSSWELAYVMYLIDHNIEFVRNTKEYFEYIFNDETHRFFPDYILSDNTYVEIKGMQSEQTDCKVRDFPKDKKLTILYWDDIKPYIEYAETTYGKEFYTLYDKDKPSWMSNNSKLIIPT